jgi:DNA-binding Xre family transcriptional regulator
LKQTMGVDMPKYKQILCQKQIMQIDLAKAVGMDKSNISKIVQGHILPNKRSFIRICDFLDVYPLDLYDKNELNLLAVRKANRAPLEPQNYRLSVRIPRDDCEILLDPTKLEKCGYGSITEWVKICLRRLQKQYEHITKWEEKHDKTRIRRLGKRTELGRDGGNSKVDSEISKYHNQPTKDSQNNI